MRIFIGTFCVGVVSTYGLTEEVVDRPGGAASLEAAARLVSNHAKIVDFALRQRKIFKQSGGGN